LNPVANSWAGQVTTGHGVMILAPTLLAMLAGTMSWSVALPLLVAGIVGLAWPENEALKDAARTTTTDLETAVAAYQRSLAATGSKGSVPPVPGPSGLAVLAVAGLSLVACSGTTPEQKAAEMRTLELGIACLADTTTKVAVVAATPTPDAMKVADAATVVGSEFAADPACGAPVPTTR
jgi:hypothetical protein